MRTHARLRQIRASLMAAGTGEAAQIPAGFVLPRSS
jgi:hypothetical protein